MVIKDTSFADSSWLVSKVIVQVLPSCVTIHSDPSCGLFAISHSGIVPRSNNVMAARKWTQGADHREKIYSIEGEGLRVRRC